ncbi:MAG TPA: hypothetical protein GXZ22_02215 [Clostridiaceae bacterium]|nr:hypothetical protein [Clostridiaceae bacterium]
MSPAIKHGFYAKVLKFIIIIPVLIAIIFALVKGNFFARAVILSIVISSLLFKLWRRRHYKETEYDEIGYWSGLDDFELGIDLHCFNDLEISDDELDLFPGDYYDGRPV